MAVAAELGPEPGAAGVIAKPAGAAELPGKTRSSSESQQHSSLQNAKQSANQALDHISTGFRQAVEVTKKSANKVLQSVDDTVHGRRDTGGGPAKEH